MTEVEILQVDTGPSQKSLADLKKEIKDAKSELLNLEEGTDAYNKKLVEIGDKLHQVKEIQRQTAQTTTDLGDRLAATKGAVAGVTGAVQTAVGALSLMGVEMGDDVKVLKTLQSLMAITTGFQAIDGGVKAFKALTISIKASAAAMSGLKKALISTGFGALAVAVGLLVNALSKLKEKQEEAAEAARLHNEQLQKQLNLEERLSKAKTDYYQKQYQQLGIIQNLESRLAKNRAMWQEEFRKGNISQYELDKKLVEEETMYRTRAADQMAAKYSEILKHEGDEAWKSTAEGKKVWREYFEFKAVAAYNDYEQQSALMQEWEAFNEKKVTSVAATTKQIAKETNQAIKDEIEADEPWYFVDTEFLNREREIILSQSEDMTEQLILLDMDRNTRREEILRQNYAANLLEETEYNEQLAKLYLERANLEVELETNKNEKIKAAEEKAKADEAKNLEDRKKKYDNYRKAVSVVTSSVSSILGSIGETLEQGSQEWKAVKTAEAIISTIQGGISAYMGMVESIPGPAGIIAGAASAAATVAAGMVEVKKIQDTEISTEGGATASGTSALGSINQQAISVAATQVTNTRQTSTVSDVENLPDTKVYVLESEITDAQKNVKATVKQATF